MNSRQPIGFPGQLGASSRTSRRGPNLPTGQLLVAGAILAALLLLFVIGSTGGTEQAEADTEDRIDLVSIVQPALTRAGYGSVQVESDGRTVTLSGELPTRTDVVAADAVVKSIAEVGFVINNLSHPGQAELDEIVPDDGSDNNGFTGSGTISTEQLALQNRLSATAGSSPITFQTGAAELTPESDTTLTAIAALLVDNPAVRIEVGGHTDSDGVPEENEVLSQARADAVVASLVGKGVEAGRLQAVGYGDALPIASNETGEGKAQNRRIEFLLLG